MAKKKLALLKITSVDTFSAETFKKTFVQLRRRVLFRCLFERISVFRQRASASARKLLSATIVRHLFRDEFATRLVYRLKKKAENVALVEKINILMFENGYEEHTDT